MQLDPLEPPAYGRRTQLLETWRNYNAFDPISQQELPRQVATGHTGMVAGSTRMAAGPAGRERGALRGTAWLDDSLQPKGKQQLIGPCKVSRSIHASLRSGHRYVLSLPYFCTSPIRPKYCLLIMSAHVLCEHVCVCNMQSAKDATAAQRRLEARQACMMREGRTLGRVRAPTMGELLAWDSPRGTA